MKKLVGNQKNSLVEALFFGTILLFIIRGLEFAAIGAYAPLLFVVLAMTGFLLLRICTTSRPHLHHRLWGLFLIIYGLVRASLWLMINTGVAAYSLASDNMTFGYLALTIFYLFSGLFLVRKRQPPAMHEP